MATNYARGADFERRCLKKLEGLGYFVVRSAGSHSPVDLVAFSDVPYMIPLLIQCKLDGRLAYHEHVELVNLGRRYHGLPVLVSRGQKWVYLSGDRQRTPLDLGTYNKLTL